MSKLPNMHNHPCNLNQPLIPPISPVPGLESFSTYNTFRNDLKHHQRASSESMIVEEQPSWVDDLLNEPETPIKKGPHRRSSSDSFAYLDVPNISSNLHIPASLEFNGSLMPLPSWRIQELDWGKDLNNASYYHGRPHNRRWETFSVDDGYQKNAFSRIKNSPRNMGPLRSYSEADNATSSGTKNQNQNMSAHQNIKPPTAVSDIPRTNNSQLDTEQKRIKQQFAQRSRVRKLQYIAELERNVKALQAEGSDASAEVQFIDQQNIILSMENETLRQRLDSLNQEHLLKKFQQEMLEREIARLRSFLLQKQQHQHQLPSYTHGRSSSRDLDSQFANFSLK